MQYKSHVQYSTVLEHAGEDLYVFSPCLIRVSVDGKAATVQYYSSLVVNLHYLWYYGEPMGRWHRAPSSNGKGHVILELYSSQRCSSCYIYQIEVQDFDNKETIGVDTECHGPVSF